MTTGGEHTIGRWLADSARSHPDRIAIDDRGVTTTYADLEQRTRRLTERLGGAGYAPGDRIATLTGNSTDHVVWLFACARLGIALVPLSWRSAAAELAGHLELADPALLVIDDEYAALAADAASRLAEPPASVPITAAALPSRTHRSPGAAHRAARDEDPLLILFTSGSSGHAKAAVLTHATCFWTNVSFSKIVPLTRDDVVLAVLPQYHAAGWNVQPLLAWSVGATVVLERTFDPRRVLRLIAERGVTTMMGVPTLYQRLSETRDFDTADLSTLDTAVCGGAPMPAPLLRRWHARGVRLTQGYGLTEAGPNVLCLPPEDAFDHVGSAGRPYPHVEVALADPVTGAHLTGPATGELLVRGPGLFAGYFRDPDATARAWSGGWLRTGDLASRDAAGYHTILDRIDHLYITGGENVSPAEVEQALLRHPAVEQVAVIGVPDERWGEVGMAHVVARPGVPVDAEELQAHCRSLLAAHKAPAHVVFTDALPTAGLEKVSRHLLAERSRP